MKAVSEKLITIADNAATKLREYIRKERSLSAGLRITVEKDYRGCIKYGLEIVDAPSDDDVITEENGVKIYVDSKIKDDVRGAKIGYLKSARAFKVTNFNYECGPGCESKCECP
jgi:iron-sulfur cluster assembly protein